MADIILDDIFALAQDFAREGALIATADGSSSGAGKALCYCRDDAVFKRLAHDERLA